MEYSIDILADARSDLNEMSVFDRRVVLDGIAANLKHEPTLETRNRKRLGPGLEVGFEFVPPLWELRIREFRVFYDVNEELHCVYIRRVRLKPPGTSTQEIVK